MALIKCPECGKEISDKAANCIHCGCPLHEGIESPKNNSLSKPKSKFDESKAKKWGLLLAGCLVVFILIGCLMYKPMKYKSGMDKMESGDYRGAMVVFKELGDYSDSKLYYEESLKHIHADYKFLDAIEQSILKRRELNKDNTEYEILTKTELAYLVEFKTARFYDKNLEEMALWYIRGLELQQDALKLNNIEYLIKWETGHLTRVEALERLYENYGFMSYDKEFVATYVGASEELKEELAALKSIKADLENQMEGVTLKHSSSTTVYTTYTNNTNYDFHLNLYVTYYDKDRRKIDSSSFLFMNNMSGKTTKISIHWPKSARTCQWGYEVTLIE